MNNILAKSKSLKTVLPNVKLSSDQLKIIAIIIMAIDHVGYGIVHLYLTTQGMMLDPDSFQRINKIYEIMKGIGRLAFPIFCFCLVEGFYHTHSRVQYIIRMFLFALISEIPFNLALYQKVFAPEHQDVMFSMCIGLVTLCAIDYVRNIKGLSSILMGVLIFSITCASMQVAQILLVDYKWRAILVIVVFYILHDFAPANLIAGAGAMSFEKYAPAAMILLFFYDASRKPSKHLKYFFYLFYPAHLLLIYLIGRSLGL